MVTNIYMNGEFWICIAILLVSSSSEDVVMREPRGIYVLHLVRVSIFSCECQLTLVKSRCYGNIIAAFVFPRKFYRRALLFPRKYYRRQEI